VFEHLFLPIARDFDPQLVLVCAGFDAAKGDPMGQFQVTPQCFGVLTAQLKTLAQGKLVLALEGGYNPEVVANCVEECLKALLNEDPHPRENSSAQVKSETLQQFQQVKAVHSKKWSVVVEPKTGGSGAVKF